MSTGAMNQPVQSEDSRSTDLRAKIIGILSDTANGCISELGYFPSLLRKLCELEQANNKWKEENVRLFQDNRALAQYTRRQEEHIKTVATPPDSAFRVALLEEQVKTLNMQNLELRRLNETLVASSSTDCNHLAHQHQRSRLTNDQQSSSHTTTHRIHHLHDNNIALHDQNPRQQIPINQRVLHGYSSCHSPSTPMGTPQQIADSPLVLQNTSLMPNPRMDHSPVLTPMQMNGIMPGVRPQPLPVSLGNSAHPPMPRRRDLIQIRPPIAQPPSSCRRTSRTVPALTPSFLHRTSNSPQIPSLDNDQGLSDGAGWVDRPPNSPHSNQISPSPTPTTNPLEPQQVATDLPCPLDPTSAKTPIGSNPETLPAWIASDQMKREREDMDSLDTELARKKIRLGDTDLDDESDQEIEVDSDGLRSIASCISELMENSVENPGCYRCRLCEMRYKTGVILEAPTSLIGATQEQLAEHLRTEHADAWETLRRDV